MESQHSPALTKWLHDALQGDEVAEVALLDALNQELREIARQIAPRGSVQPTALVNEVWLRLFRGNSSPEFKDRTAFIRYVTRAMRNLLLDHLRKQRNQRQVPLDEVVENIEGHANVPLLELEEAMAVLERQAPRRAELVTLRFYGGLSNREIADHLGVSVGTVERDWRLARAQLRVLLDDDAEE